MTPVSQCSGDPLSNPLRWLALFVLAGMIACMATSCRDPPTTQWQTRAYLLNVTGAPVDVRLRYFDGELDCPAIADRAPRALATSTFGEGVRFHLEPGQTIPLSEPDVLLAAGQADAFAHTPAQECEIVLIQSDAIPSTIVWWSDLTDRAVPVTIEGTDIGEHADLLKGLVSLIVDKDGKTAAVGWAPVKTGLASESVDPSSCIAQGDAFQWSEISLADSQVVIGAIDSLPGGCLDLSLTQPASQGEGGAGGAGPNAVVDHFALCVPESAFPFKVGDTVILREPIELGSPGDGAGIERSLEMTSSNTWFFVRTGHAQGSHPLPADMTFTPADCEGDRAACGAFTVPVSFEQPGVAPIQPGKEATINGPNGKKVRVIVGRAEQVLASRSDCEPGRSAIGLSLDYIVTGEGGM